MRYLVTWKAVIEAETPEDAALLAYTGIRTDPSKASFLVTTPDGKVAPINLG